MAAGNSNESTGQDNLADLRQDMDILNQEDGVPSGGNDENIESRRDTEGDEERAPRTGDKDPLKKDEEDEDLEKKDDKEDKEDEEEEEIKEGADKKDDVDTQRSPHRPTVSEIKAKYPDFFKQFPDLRHMLFREGEYTNLFPTVDEAKEAATKAEDFDNFSEMLTSGTPEKFQEFMTGVKTGGALLSMAANFLPSLYKTDADMYYKVTSPIAESLLRGAYRHAQQKGDKDLENAALHLAIFAFNDAAFATGEKTSPPLKAEEKTKDPEFEKEKKDFYTQKYNETKGFVTTTAANRLKAEIRKGLDPNGVFGDFTSKALERDILEEVGATLQSDERHMRTINSLWKQAEKAGFTGNWKDRILSTYLSGARAIMPAIRTRLRNSALGDYKKENNQREEVAERGKDRKEVHGQGGGRNTGGNRRPPTSREIDWGKTSDMDILNDRVTLRK